MRILLTNDDGIHAPGITAARAALLGLGEVWTVAPERPRSAAGHAITLHKPLRLTPVQLADGAEGWASNGTPTDCVTLGYDVLMESRCDLVVSGINSGPNLGWDLTYSGTVSAAMEGAVLNVPSFAVSVALPVGGPPSAEVDYGPAARITGLVARKLVEEGIPPHMLLNVNVPPVPQAEIAGVSITHQGSREYVDRVVPRIDPSGRPYYWQTGSIREAEHDPDSDVHAILNNRISITPVHLDLTAYSLLEQLRSWNL